MSLPFKSMAEVAERVGVEHCRGITPTGQYCDGDHRRGFADETTVHFADRRVTRASIRQFAVLAARVTTGPGVDEYPAWKRQWLLSSIAEETCRRRLRVRIPNKHWDLDRWTVRAQLADVPVGTPQRQDAMAWAVLAR